MRRSSIVLACFGLCGPVLAEGTWPPPDHFRTPEPAAEASRPAQPAGRQAAAGRAPAANLKGAAQRPPVRKTSADRAAAASGKAASGKAAANDKAEAKKDEDKLRPKLPPAAGAWRWKVVRAEWTEADEQGYEEFVSHIGESECTTVHDCLTSPAANPRFHDRHPPGMRFAADCADLPFALRAYFAWQSGLPFSFPVRLAHHPRTTGHRSGLLGHQTTERHDIVGPGPDPRLALPVINAFVSSEHFRSPPAYAGKLPNDHYPVRIDRGSIRPGTVIFDPDGHLAVVYRVTDDGRVLYIDSHPDNSLTRGTFNREFDRTEPPMGAGFKRWRPQRLVGARPAPDGTLAGGRIVLAADHELADWSDEQFFGNASPRPLHWSDGRFVIDGQPMQFHEYVRLRLARPGFRYDPLGEVRVMLRQLCRDFRYRVDAVELAIKAGIDRRPQPERLPRNIYATSGEWEVYSTPSRDARIKTAFEELRDEVERFLELAAEQNRILDYAGGDLRRDLLHIYRAEAAACSITYRRSDGSPVTLGFEELKRRLFKLSFDPYHCVERRWGADSPAELATCAEDATKRAWYVAEQRLRQQLVRTYGEQMGWSLAELQNAGLDIGIAEAPEIDPLAVLTEVEGTEATARTEVKIPAATRPCPPGNTRRKNRSVRHCAN